MCLGLAGEIVAILPEHKDLATANVMGAQRTVNISTSGERADKAR